MEYDSTADTLAHIRQVNTFLLAICQDLMNRAVLHDESKLSPPEKEAFDKYTPALSSLTYGSEEYHENLSKMRPAIEHHQANNSHHPEYHTGGIDGMTLMDLVEMLADWKAATMRHADGSIWKSLEINRQRFGISDQLFRIFENTIVDLWD